MKKLVFLVAICLLPNLVMAEGEWPVFSNQDGAEQNLEKLMVIGSNNDKTYSIGKFEYQIAEFNCMKLVEAANKDKAKVAEFRPGEVLAEEGTTYNLYIDDALVNGTETMIKRQALSAEEDVDLNNKSADQSDVGGSSAMQEEEDEGGKAKKPSKGGLLSSCNLL